MNKRNPAQVFDEIAQQQIRKDINLSSRILQSVRKENRKIMKSRFVIAGVCVIALVVVLLFTVPGVATAMKRLLGYVPNIGIVEDSTPMRILKEPVQYSHGDTTITVMQGVSDTLHTTLVYQAENIPASPAATEVEISQMCHQQPELLLPDGSRLQGQAETGNYWISGFNRRVVYPALPENVYSIKLVFACLEQTAISPDTQGWEIVLDFVDAPADMAVYPLVEFPTPTPLPTASGTEDPTLQEPAADNYQSDVNLVVEQYLQTDENLVLFGTMDSKSGQARIELLDSSAIHLTDSSGKDIPLMEDHSLANPDNKKYSNTSIQWAYVTAGDIAPGPATLTVDSVWIFLNEEVQFTFDPGENPQPDQEWILNQTVLVADREIVIQSVRMNSKGDGLSFNINVPEDVVGMNVMDLEHQLTPGGGGQGSYGFTYQDGFPSGKI